MANIDELEYIGMAGKANLGAGGFDEADVYKYGEKLILIFNNPMYKNEKFLLYEWGFRKKFFGIPDDENSNIGNDPDKLREALLKRNMDFDPSVFLGALMYVKSDR